MVGRFRGPSGARLLQRRGSLVVRKLVVRLGGRAVLSMLSSILEEERDLPFAAALVQALNLILLTAPEVRHPSAPLPPVMICSDRGSWSSSGNESDTVNEQEIWTMKEAYQQSRDITRG